MTGEGQCLRFMPMLGEVYFMYTVLSYYGLFCVFLWPNVQLDIFLFYYIVLLSWNNTVCS